MNMPIVALLDDGQIRVYETVDDILRELELVDIENDEYRFYDSQGFRLRHRIDASERARTLFGLVPVIEWNVRFYDYDPPLDGSSELREAFLDCFTHSQSGMSDTWVESASLNELIEKVRRTL